MPNEPPIGPPWTIKKILEWTAAYFKEHIPENPRIDAEILLAHCLGCQRLDLYLNHDRPLDAKELSHYRQLITRRLKREPVAYILGHREFWSLTFNVTSEVLIPRPETECLVEAALQTKALDSKLTPQPHILELGVGSGAISIALAKECMTCRILATDVNLSAVNLSKSNALRHGVGDRICFLVAHWFDALKPYFTEFDMLVSNPPYICNKDLPGLSPDIFCYEPLTALDGGEMGMECLDLIIRSAPSFLKPGGYVVLEMGCDQKEPVKAVALQCGAYQEIVFHKDYGGKDRVAVMRTPYQ